MSLIQSPLRYGLVGYGFVALLLLTPGIVFARGGEPVGLFFLLMGLLVAAIVLMFIISSYFANKNGGSFARKTMRILFSFAICILMYYSLIYIAFEFLYSGRGFSIYESFIAISIIIVSVCFSPIIARKIIK